MIPIASTVLAVLLLSLRRADVPRKKTAVLAITSFSIFVLVRLGIYFQGAFLKMSHIISVFVQWWLASDQILFRRFLAHQAMGRALVLGLTINILGMLSLYLPIDVFFKRVGVNKVREWLEEKFPWLEIYLEKVDEYSNGLSSSRAKDFAFDLIEKWESKHIWKSEYFWLLILPTVPVPILGTALTAGAIMAKETLEIKHGIWFILLSKVVKVLGWSAIAFFAHFL